MEYIKKNIIYIILFFGCLLAMLLFAINETNIFYIVKEYIFNSNYRNNFYLVEGNLPTSSSILGVIGHVFKHYRWTYDTMIIWGTNIFQLLLPCISAISGLIIFNKIGTIFKFSLYRSGEKKLNYIMKKSVIISFKISMAIFLSYVVFYIICLLISGGISNSSVSRSLLLDLIGENFYYMHTYLYYFIDGIIRLFIIPFIYSLFSCSIALLVKTQKQAFLLPIAIYFGLNFISIILRFIVGDIAIYISPITILVSGTYSTINTPLLLCLHFIFVIVSYFIMRWRTKNGEI